MRVFIWKAGGAAAAATIWLLAAGPPTVADETHAKDLLKEMSDYLSAEKAISFSYDSDLEIVTPDLQKIDFASSGTVALSRPDKIRVTRTGGFADVELVFDGKMMTIHGKNLNLYAQAEMSGTLDQLVEELRTNFNVHAPGADLLLSNSYDELMAGVVDVKDLGSGVIRGVECNHLAFRAENVDWQIWIAMGDKPYPCRYVVTSKLIAQGPEYSVEISDWKTGDQVVADDFSFKNMSNAEKAELSDLKDIDELPNLTAEGATP